MPLNSPSDEDRADEDRTDEDRPSPGEPVRPPAGVQPALTFSNPPPAGERALREPSRGQESLGKPSLQEQGLREPPAPEETFREQALRAQLATLPFLPQSWRRPGGLPETETVWRYLQEWVPQALLHMDELEGYLLSARREPAFRAFDPEGTLADVARVRQWLQQLRERSDWMSFVEQLRSRPVLLSAYQRLSNLLVFFRGPQRSRLVAVYSYLTDEGLALPEGESFRELRDLHATLLDMLGDARTLEDVQERQRLWDGFDAFLFRYKKIYAREHDRLRRPEVLAPYGRLRERPQFRLLQRLRKLHGAPVKAGLQDLEERIARILATQCPGVDEAWLDARPTCTCGYRLGAPPPEPLENLEADLETALIQGLRLFRDPEVRRRLDLARQVLAEAGKEREASGIARLLAELDAAEPDPARVEALLDDAMVSLLNGALSATAPVVPRPLEALVEELAGREWSWEALQEAVALWAFGDVQPPPGRLVLPLWSAEGGRSARTRRARRSDASREPVPETIPLPQSFSEWEQGYGKLVKRRVQGQGEAVGEDARLQRAFREFYRRCLRDDDGSGASLVALSLFEPRVEKGLLAGLQKPLTLPLVLRRAMDWLDPARGTRGLLWIDALRCDVWLRALERLQGRGEAVVEVLDGGLLWAWPPATTAGQMARLDAQGIRFSLLEVDGDPEALPVPARSEGGRGLEAGRAPVPVVYLRVLEEAINRPDPPPPEELVELLVQYLRPLLFQRPGVEGPGAEWLVFGDHGFVELVAQDPPLAGENRVYAQGGESMEEVLVPWAHLRVRAGQDVGAGEVLH